MVNYNTNYRYTDRKTKAKYVWLKYQSILEDSILDVGADKCHLRDYLRGETRYLGIGFGEDVDQKVNLERDKLPFADDSFNCVLCLDVLEHLDNIHQVFDELCRVSRRYVIISFPNPWAEFYHMLCFGDYRPDRPMKFYGLTAEPPEDRHKWFFSNAEAEKFITYRAAKNGLRVIQMDNEGFRGEGTGFKGSVRILARKLLFRGDLNVRNLYAGTLWAVLEKRGDGRGSE